ncbi:hypothetical protein MMC13_003693 [Lambiella insularis]|nr:hypothetical protein [Lambiella insularis]
MDLVRRTVENLQFWRGMSPIHRVLSDEVHKFESSITRTCLYVVPGCEDRSISSGRSLRTYATQETRVATNEEATQYQLENYVDGSSNTLLAAVVLEGTAAPGGPRYAVGSTTRNVEHSCWTEAAEGSRAGNDNPESSGEDDGPSPAKGFFLVLCAQVSHVKIYNFFLLMVITLLVHAKTDPTAEETGEDLAESVKLTEHNLPLSSKAQSEKSYVSITKADSRADETQKAQEKIEEILSKHESRTVAMRDLMIREYLKVVKKASQDIEETVATFVSAFQHAIYHKITAVPFELFFDNLFLTKDILAFASIANKGEALQQDLEEAVKRIQKAVLKHKALAKSLSQLKLGIQARKLFLEIITGISSSRKHTMDSLQAMKCIFSSVRRTSQKEILTMGGVFSFL